jgi:hypothetical protein
MHAIRLAPLTTPVKSSILKTGNQFRRHGRRLVEAVPGGVYVDGDTRCFLRIANIFSLDFYAFQFIPPKFPDVRKFDLTY